MTLPTVILDRDGVINYEADGPIKSPDAWEAIPGSLPAIARLSQGGYRVIVVTYQSGLARRLLSIEDLVAINQKMLNHLAQFGGTIDAIFFCPCGPRDSGCECSKPRPGLLHDIARRLRINLQDTAYVGDALSDIRTARAAGARAILVGDGSAELQANNTIPADVPAFSSLAAYVDDLLTAR